ncbi:MAG: hypothetical protein ACTSPY_12765 [Candidatus Helarchaeota archaeon]
MIDKMNKEDFKKKRREIITKILTDLDIKVDKSDYISVSVDDLTFKMYFWGNLVRVGYSECMSCEIDCNKEIYVDIDPDKSEFKDIKYLTNEDIMRLGKLYSILKNTNEIDFDEIKIQLREQLNRIKFVIIGFNSNEIMEIFNSISGMEFEIDFLKRSKCKIIETFPQLLIELIVLSEDAMNNFISDSPAPILIEFLKDTYGFLIISDSTSMDVTNIKEKILPKIYHNIPFALCLILGLHYGTPNHLKPDLINKILNRKVYGIIYEDKIQSFMEILYKSVLLRINQMKESGCKFIDEEL